MQTILETPRLLLREKIVEDAPFLMALNADPSVTQYTGNSAFKNSQEAEDVVRYVIDQYKRNGYGRWLVSEKETNEPVGWCGLKYDEETGETDLGYRFMKKYWGKGYATEASLACINYGFNALKLKRMIGTVMAENKASVQVLKKVGMTFLENTIFDTMPSYIYQITKDM